MHIDQRSQSQSREKAVVVAADKNDGDDDLMSRLCPVAGVREGQSGRLASLTA